MQAASSTAALTVLSGTCTAGAAGRANRSTSSSVRCSVQPSRIACASKRGARPAQMRRMAEMRSVSATAWARISSTLALAATGWGAGGGEGGAAGVGAAGGSAGGVWLVSSMTVSPEVGLAMAATLALVAPSAPRSTKLISPSVALRTTLRGPLYWRPLTMTFWVSLTNSNSSTLAPTEACQGKPFLELTTTSRAADVSRDTRPVATSCPWSTRIASVCPTPESGSCPKRIGRACDGIAKPAKSMITG